MPRDTPKHVRRVRAKGRVYYYFDTGKRIGAKKVWTRLPDLKSLDFWGSYSTLMGHRNRKSGPSAMLIPELVALYEKSDAFLTELAPSSQEAYSMYLRRLEKLLPTAPVAQITRGDMQRLVDGMAKTKGAANLFLGTCGALFRWAVGRDYMQTNPTLGIERFKLGEHEPWPGHVLKAALVTDDRTVRLLTHLLLYTALRLNDMLALQWSQIDGEYLSVRHKKTRRDMRIKLHDNLRAELAKEPRRGLYIAVNENGERIGEQMARIALQAFAAKLGVKVVPHGLRKNAVNSLLEVGASVAETAAVSGQSLQMVEHYAKKRDQAKLSSGAILKWETKGESAKK